MNYSLSELHISLLGEAPIRTQATARKCRETPMGRTGITGLRFYIRWLNGLFLLRRVVPKLKREGKATVLVINLGRTLFLVCFPQVIFIFT